MLRHLKNMAAIEKVRRWEIYENFSSGERTYVCKRCKKSFVLSYRDLNTIYFVSTIAEHKCRSLGQLRKIYAEKRG
jgi:hypothetical protein